MVSRLMTHHRTGGGQTVRSQRRHQAPTALPGSCKVQAGQRTRQWDVRAAQVHSSGCIGSALVTSDTRAHRVVTSALAAAGGGGVGGSCSAVIGPGPAGHRSQPRVWLTCLFWQVGMHPMPDQPVCGLPRSCKVNTAAISATSTAACTSSHKLVR